MLRFKYSNILHKMQIKTEKNFYYCVIEYIFAFNFISAVFIIHRALYFEELAIASRKCLR